MGCGRRSLKCFIYSAVISHFETFMVSETFSDSHLCILLLLIISPLTRGVMCFSNLLSMSGEFPCPLDGFFPAVCQGGGGIVKKASEHCISNHPSQPPVSADNFRNKLFYQASDKNLSFLGKNDTGNQRLFKNHTHTRDLPKVACVPGRTDRPLIGQEIGFYRVAQTPRISAFRLCLYIPINET